MSAIRIEPFAGRPLLDIVSFGRAGPGRRDRLGPAELAQIARTVGRMPEVMVKVLTRGSHDIGSVSRHVGYLSRKGELELETDEGERVGGKVAEREVVRDWNLDLEDYRRTDELTAGGTRRKPAKLVHKLVLSMPPGTPPNAILNATRNFLREEFGLRHRYAFVLHADEPHPHVHAVVKAVGEQGERLHIRKPTLRRWRSEFARHLRAHGVAANATERAVRGQVVGAKHDAIYRIMCEQQRPSRHFYTKVSEVTKQMQQGKAVSAPGKERLRATRGAVMGGWLGVAQRLRREGHAKLATATVHFTERLSVPRTEQERIAHGLRDQERARVQECAR